MRCRERPFVPKAAVSNRSKPAFSFDHGSQIVAPSGTISLRRSFDQLVSDQQDVAIDRQSHRLGSLHVDDQLELGWSFDR